ncbi:YbgC/FadM family acyl-CoA thioesterase [Ramlibacter aquaticus]|uniref:YbgC/FadM family acyl-CoA thioesterase n=2 Tax=Comamonadaceae TaxID=80864 RepID=A0ABR9SEL5_9BURK|nr:YbgC/FadM family acyl-CoA thioesterase [Ramlibacter aquaticus]
MHRKDYRFFHRLRVRWAEVDLQKIVFNAHYLMYFDTAVADYWRALALPYYDAMHVFDGDLYVKKATVEFHASARLDDRLDIGMKCSRIGTSSMAFHGTIFRGDQRLIDGELLYVFANPETQKSRPVPPAFRAILEGFEAGEGMLALRTGPWAELQEPCSRLRTQVFVQEQGIPADEEYDAQDATALHALALNRLGQPVATARLLQQAPGVALIGRVAVHPVLRGSGVGRELMQAVMQKARERGDREVVLNAQTSAERFYLGLGFQRNGPEFEEVGIPHVPMRRTLVPA